MKDMYKNPTLYYIIVPVALALWPLLARVVYLPAAEKNWQNEKVQYTKAQQIMAEILTIDPDRLNFADANGSAAKFDYTVAVDKIANQFRISAANYKISSRPITTSGGQKSQTAVVILKEIDITKLANFLSTMQLRWANLQCTQANLTKKKGLPDTWDVELEFKYYY